jgi:hypothetical protein
VHGEGNLRILPGNPQKASGNFFPSCSLSILILFLFSTMLQCHMFVLPDISLPFREAGMKILGTPPLD